MNINDDYTTFFKRNRALVLFAEQEIHDLAQDNFHEHGLHPENAFETIFDDYLFVPDIYLHDDWFIVGDDIRQMQIFCEKGFEIAVAEIRSDWKNGLTDPGENIGLLPLPAWLPDPEEIANNPSF